MNIEASKFMNRAELEEEIGAKFPRTTNHKPNHKITGTRAELARLQLSNTTHLWGIEIVCTDTPSERHPEYKKPVFDFYGVRTS